MSTDEQAGGAAHYPSWNMHSMAMNESVHEQAFISVVRNVDSEAISEGS